MGCLSLSLSLSTPIIIPLYHYPNLLGVHPILAVKHHGGRHRGHIARLFGETGPDNRHIRFFLSPCHMMTFFSYLSYLWVDLPYTSSVIPPDAFWYFSRSPRLCSRIMKHCEKEVSERVTNLALYWGLLLISDGSIDDWSHSEINQVF